jgi:hypothetical protein
MAVRSPVKRLANRALVRAAQNAAPRFSVRARLTLRSRDAEEPLAARREFEKLEAAGKRNGRGGEETNDDRRESLRLEKPEP